MTTAPAIMLADDSARRVAIAALDRSLLVEAGAGSGKTAVMAARIVMLLAAGVAPKRIAAVTFTELAASELLVRVREFVHRLLSEPAQTPAEMLAALPTGLDAAQRARLASANDAIDEMTCSTIHGFCQRLIKPYPVEADIDPGATLVDRDQGELAFQDIADDWLRATLATDRGLLAELALRDPGQTVDLVHQVLGLLHRHRHAVAPSRRPLRPLALAFVQASEDLAAFLRDCGDAAEAETVERSLHLQTMARAVADLLDGDDPCRLAGLAFVRPDPQLLTASGAFRKLRAKGAWREAARRAGHRLRDGEQRFEDALARHDACCAAWEAFSCEIASHVLAEVVALLQPVLDRFRAYKREAGLLDFDDLIHAARDLLRDHEPVRQALAQRYTHVLVDEFQDTDPLQAEIFWRLCGDPAPGGDRADWAGYRIRPGALFLVGDPKQAIYRFRGADVAAFVQARSAFAAQDPGSILTISTNFRSRAPILQYINERFAALLSEQQGQPGFTALTPFHATADESPCVVALDVPVLGSKGAESQRDAEAEAVAALCARLIGTPLVVDRGTGAKRACRPGDIALLAPTGSDLWRYEEALERLGVPVATQAGKGLYRRQEIQDLIALTRVLADPADTLAFGALLRGPLVGLSEEALLDIVQALPAARLTLGTDVRHIANPLVRQALETLQALRRMARATTPYDLLARAVEVMHVRALLWLRHGGQAERALANVDLYLSMARPYAVRGLRAFAEAMTSAWEDASRAPEGRPDAQEEAVALYTVHAAKGLEWPIVVPINTMTQTRAADSALVDRITHCVHCPVFGLTPSGLAQARDAEQQEVERERIRLWYVAVTRARDLLVLPRLADEIKGNAWVHLPQFPLADLPALDLAALPARLPIAPAPFENRQTGAVFAGETACVAGAHRRIRWLAPSRDEAEPAGAASARRISVEPGAIAAALDEAVPPEAVPTVQGGRERGLLIHKLLEEVLNGEVHDAPVALQARAAALIGMLGLADSPDPGDGVSSAEVARCVARTLALPDIAAIRDRLVPEYAVLSARRPEAEDAEGAEEAVTVGVADAIAFDDAGRPMVVVDWKSDVRPAPRTIEHYRAQVGQYLAMTGAPRGMVVLVTTGRIVEVRHPDSAMHG